MKTIYFKELKAYKKEKLLRLLNKETFDNLLKYDFIKKEDYNYIFNYVGVIIVDEFVINCYPKYIPNEENIESDFKEILRVIKKYKHLNEDFEYENETLDEISYNRLSMMLFFLEDYYENGVYTNIQNILEINGNGEIDWDRTINYTDPIIDAEKPFYVELQTKYKINNLFDYFRLLHEYIITECSKNLEKAGLLDLFDLTPVEISDKNLDDFGENVLELIEKEINVEFNSHKQKLLKTMHSFINEENSFTNETSMTIFGTQTYHVIWEEICSDIFSNKIKNIKSHIKKPKWYHKYKTHKTETFKPDIVTWIEDTFVILDAKYYNLTFNEEELSGNPGLGDITKQYLYQLALEDFRTKKGFTDVKNALLFPSYNDYFENKGYVEIEILSDLGLENIQVIMLPASNVNKAYLENKKKSILELKLK